MSSLTNCFPSWPPCRQQAVFFNDACGAIYILECGGVALVVAYGSAAR